jgi:hypothetical protein
MVRPARCALLVVFVNMALKRSLAAHLVLTTQILKQKHNKIVCHVWPVLTALEVVYQQFRDHVKQVTIAH